MSSPALKNPNGWFAAGREWQRAMRQLSDGAFKLFVWISLQAERATGRLAFRQAEPAQALGKSRRSLGTYLQELERKGVCRRCSAPNPYRDGVLQVSEPYWPYQGSSAQSSGSDPEEKQYLEAIRRLLGDHPCLRLALSAADRQRVKQWSEQALPWGQVEQAILMGCGRKYVSWLNGQPGEPIGSLHYFTPLLEEIAKLELSTEYGAFNRLQVQKLKRRWLATQPSTKPKEDRACENFAQAKAPKTGETR